MVLLGIVRKETTGTHDGLGEIPLQVSVIGTDDEIQDCYRTEHCNTFKKRVDEGYRYPREACC